MALTSVISVIVNALGWTDGALLQLGLSLGVYVGPTDGPVDGIAVKLGLWEGLKAQVGAFDTDGRTVTDGTSDG